MAARETRADVCRSQLVDPCELHEPEFRQDCRSGFLLHLRGGLRALLLVFSLGLKCWEPGDVPWLEHARFSPSQGRRVIRARGLKPPPPTIKLSLAKNNDTLCTIGVASARLIRLKPTYIFTSYSSLGLSLPIFFKSYNSLGLTPVV